METQIRSPVEIYGSNHVQHGLHDTLYLTPNEVLFDTPGVLRCIPKEGTQKGETEDEFNRYLYFTRISNIQEDQVMVWRIQVHEACTIQVNLVEFSNQGNTGNGLFGFNIQDTEYLCQSLSPTISDIHLSKGIHEIRFYLISNQTPTLPIADLMCLKLTCSKLDNLSVIRIRWRPNACHTTFSSSETKQVDAWVMSLKPHHTQKAYCPMTTPFGYYGMNLPPAPNQVPNFSLWSYGTKDPKPPTHQLSRILAIGDPDAEFGEFHHEGHGVKVRGGFSDMWKDSKEYIFGLRIQKEENQMYSYYAYYWDQTNWKLFAMGQQYRKKPFKSMKIGSFIEVTGGPDFQRSGHFPREVSYFGYCRDKEVQTWHQLDQVEDKKSKALLSDKKRKIRDQRFVCSTGGFKKTLKLENTTLVMEEVEETPLYLDQIREMEAPVLFPMIRDVKIKKNRLKWKITLPKRGPTRLENKVRIYYGREDFEWDDFYEVPKLLLDGRRSVMLDMEEFEDEYEKGEEVCFRIFTQNSEIQIWSKTPTWFTF